MNKPVIKGRLIDAPIMEILKDLKSECTNGKLSYIDRKQGKWIRVSCPFHSDGLEKNASAGVYNGDDPKIEKGTLHCFTCSTYVPLYKVVASCLECSDENAKKWLLKRYGGARVEENIELKPITLNEKAKIEYLNESLLDSMQSWHPYMAKRKLTQEVCNRFKIKYDPVTECIVFPVYDIKNKLVMITKRSVNSKEFYIDEDKEKPIYLLNEIKNKDYKTVIVCESQINALTAWSWGYPSIATFGTGISPYQFKILNKSGIEHYILALDADNAGYKGIRRFYKYIRKDVIIDVVEIPKGKDVNDLTKEEFDNLPIYDINEWLSLK